MRLFIFILSFILADSALAENGGNCTFLHRKIVREVPGGAYYDTEWATPLALTKTPQSTTVADFTLTASLRFNCGGGGLPPCPAPASLHILISKGAVSTEMPALVMPSTADTYILSLKIGKEDVFARCQVDNR